MQLKIHKQWNKLPRMNLWSVHMMLSRSALSFSAGSVTESSDCVPPSCIANTVLLPMSGESPLLVTLAQLSTFSSTPSITVSKLSVLLVSGNASLFADLKSDRSAEWSSEVELMHMTSSAVTVAVVSDTPQCPSPRHYRAPQTFHTQPFHIHFESELLQKT